MEAETISIILICIASICLGVAMWRHQLKMHAWYAAQDKAIKELEDNWSKHVQERKTVKFNINEYVRVQLTDTGREILRQQYKELLSVLPPNAKSRNMWDGYDGVPNEDENGWSKWQLWSLMNSLGAHCHLGSEPPFQTEIEIVA